MRSSSQHKTKKLIYLPKIFFASLYFKNIQNKFIKKRVVEGLFSFSCEPKSMSKHLNDIKQK